MRVERVTDKQPAPAPAVFVPSSGGDGPGRARLPGAESQTITHWPGRWWVLHTKPRQEKCLFAALETIAVRSYLPLISRRGWEGRRSAATSVPLFPGYVFLCGTDHDRVAALRTNRVANVLDVPDQGQLREELAAIERVVSDAGSVGLFPGLKEGARCRVVRGSLAGLEGVVTRRRGPWRVYVAVTFLGQSAELEIEADDLELID